MTALMKIQSFIQAYVQAIASVLDADVTVVDNELVRVAGTGVYADEIGKTVAFVVIGQIRRLKPQADNQRIDLVISQRDNRAGKHLPAELKQGFQPSV